MSSILKGAGSHDDRSFDKRSGAIALAPAEELRQRQLVVAEALSWVGTRYFDQADRKGVGCDCAMLLVRCFVDTGVLQPFDPRPYPPQWHLHQRAERYLEWLKGLGVETASPQPGDVAVYKFGLCYSHGGILIGRDRMVGAYLKDRMVSIQELWQAEFKDRNVKYFDVFARLRAQRA